MKTAPQFLRPGDVSALGPTIGLKPGITEERADKSSFTAVFNPNRSLSIAQQRQQLPVFKCRTHFLYLMDTCQTLIIEGETGSGKSTQIPQYLNEAGWTDGNMKIAVTQPRRISCVNLANRVAEEMGVPIGREVGYAVRFDDCYDARSTRIKFLTEGKVLSQFCIYSIPLITGMLIREMMRDPLLRQYSCVMVDEAHERCLNTDIVIGLLRKIQKKRSELRIIISSATLDVKEFKSFFERDANAVDLKPVSELVVQGAVFPVKVLYTESPVADYVMEAVETVKKIHETQPIGDILVFLTGQEEIEKSCNSLREYSDSLSKKMTKLQVSPLYSGLPFADQMKVFEPLPPYIRKVIISTNLAEASVTVPNIGYVIDCGFVKLKVLNHKNGLESLVTVPVSKSSADQRAGRAGRTRDGTVLRLYTEESYEKLEPFTIPEMQRCDISGAILQLMALGVSNVLKFHYLSPPPAAHLAKSLELLYALGAIDHEGKLTDPLGIQMAEFPLSPMFAKMLLSSAEFNCSEEALTIAAMCQIQNVFMQLSPSAGGKARRQAAISKRLFTVEEGDHFSLVNVFRAFVENGRSSRWCQQCQLNYKGLQRAAELRENLKKLLKRFKIPIKSCDSDTDALGRCITSGFFANAAKHHYSGSYKTIRDNHELWLHPMSVLSEEKQPGYVIFNEIVHSSKEFMRDVTAIKPEWLYELAPHFYEYGTEMELIEKRRKLATVSTS